MNFIETRKPLRIAFSSLARAGFTLSVMTVSLAQAQTGVRPPIGNADPASASSSPTLEPVVVKGQRDDYAAPASSTATRTATPTLQTPQATQVVPRAVIQDQAAMNLQDALRNVAGVQFDFGFNGASQPLFILRGFPNVSMTAQGPMSGSANYYLDGTKVTGVPVNMANVQSVEVIKGPASVLYGRAEPGGLVNVVTKPIATVPELGFEQTIGSYGLSRTAVDASGAVNESRTLRARVAGSYYRTDSQRDFVEDRLGALSAALAWVPDARSSLTLALDYSDQRYRTDYGVPALGDRPADLPRERQFNDSPELSSSKTTTVKLAGEHQLNDVWQLKAKAVSVRSKTAEVDVTPYRIDLFTGDDCLALRNELCRYYYYARPDGRYRTTQVNADLTGKFSTGSIGHTVLVGVDSYQARKEGTTYLQQLSSVNIFNPVLGATPPLDTATAVTDLREDRVRWTSVYVQDQLALGSGVFLTGALRHDRTSAIYAAPGTEPNKESFTTPRLGAVWQFTEKQAVYAQYQDAVAANNGRQSTGEPLAAERARQFEIGHKLEAFDGKLSSTVALYQLTKRNRADYSLFPIIQTVGEARSRGLEWDVSGQVSSSLSLIGSYAYTQAVVTKDPVNEGNDLANVARHTGSLWARYAIDSQWTVGGGVFAQGQRQGDIGNTFQLPGYGRLDAMLAYRFGLAGAKASLQFNVDNLFDKRYYTGSHQFVQDWIALGSPRTAKATLRLDY